MKPDDFEQRLQQQPPRRIPAEWRPDILATARQAVPRPAALDIRSTPWWLAWLPANRPALAGLAAVWVLILYFNFSAPQVAVVTTARIQSSPKDIFMALRAAGAEFTERATPMTQGPADRPRPPAAGPRSERSSAGLFACRWPAWHARPPMPDAG